MMITFASESVLSSFSSAVTSYSSNSIYNTK